MNSRSFTILSWEVVEIGRLNWGKTNLDVSNLLCFLNWSCVPFVLEHSKREKSNATPPQSRTSKLESLRFLYFFFALTLMFNMAAHSINNSETQQDTLGLKSMLYSIKRLQLNKINVCRCKVQLITMFISGTTKNGYMGLAISIPNDQTTLIGTLFILV